MKLPTAAAVLKNSTGAASWLTALAFVATACGAPADGERDDLGGSGATGSGATGGSDGVSTGGTTGGGTATGGSAGVGGTSPGSGGTVGSGGTATGGTGGAAAGGTGGAGGCDYSEPPASVADWIDESWEAEGDNNVLNRSVWLFDSAMKGDGEINICVRWGATQTATTEIRDQIAPAMEGWFNQWFELLHPYACFPHDSVTVNVTGWAVRPGQEHLIGWEDDSIPIYTEQENGSDPPGEPKCPDSCGLFFNWDHSFPACPGGEANHFDYSLWLDDDIPGSAAAVGGDWGLRMPVGPFLSNLDNPNYGVVLHEIGHGFALSDYYTWTGSTPEGGSIMIVGSGSNGLSLGDQWILRRYWREAQADRYPF